MEHVRIHNPGNTIIESQFKNIYSFCMEMGWIKEKNDKLFLTDRGEEIHSSRSPNYLRLQL